MKTIDMQGIRYLNLFEKVTNIKTRFCFGYNQKLIFCVRKNALFRAVGQQGKNVHRISDITGKKVRIIPLPSKIEDAREFIKRIIEPVGFKNIKIENDQIIINAGRENKAALIGRNKRRFFEMQKIIEDFFGKEFKIV